MAQGAQTLDGPSSDEVAQNKLSSEPELKAEPDRPKKHWHMLENNPVVMNHLSKALGLTGNLAWHDLYSLTDPDLLAFIPRPALALLVIIPLTPAWDEQRKAEDKDMEEYTKSGDGEPVIWFKQTIGNACGSIGLVHCLINGEASKFVEPDSTLDKIRKDALPRKMKERAWVLEDSLEFEKAHAESFWLGDTDTAHADEEHRGQHFVAYVKGKDGHLYELEGGRKGPLDRGLLKEDEDVLSPAAVERGLGGLMKLESEKGGDLRFSAIALAESLE